MAEGGGHMTREEAKAIANAIGTACEEAVRLHDATRERTPASLAAQVSAKALDALRWVVISDEGWEGPQTAVDDA